MGGWKGEVVKENLQIWEVSELEKKIIADA